MGRRVFAIGSQQGTSTRAATGRRKEEERDMQSKLGAGEAKAHVPAAPNLQVLPSLEVPTSSTGAQAPPSLSVQHLGAACAAAACDGGSLSRCCCAAAAAAAATGRQPQQPRHDLQGRQQQALHGRPASQHAQLRPQARLERCRHAAWLALLRLRNCKTGGMVRQRNGVGVPRRCRNHVGCRAVGRRWGWCDRAGPAGKGAVVVQCWA